MYVQTISTPKESQIPDNFTPYRNTFSRSFTVQFSVINIRVIEENWTLYMDSAFENSILFRMVWIWTVFFWVSC